MSGRVLWYLVTACVALVAALAFLYPQPMIAPGALMAAHRSFGADCFSCHTPLAGSSASQCKSCHLPERIGRFTTTGQPIVPSAGRAPFHDHLVEQECMTCHSEHRGPHAEDANRPFSHALLQPGFREKCASCHLKPDDPLHRQLTEACQQCHGTAQWTPASFDHSKFFVLDGSHNARCATCHSGPDFSRFTCYGCHAHSEADIRAKHTEEGIRNIDNCVRCHRGGGDREGGERDD